MSKLHPDMQMYHGVPSRPDKQRLGHVARRRLDRRMLLQAASYYMPLSISFDGRIYARFEREEDALAFRDWLQRQVQSAHVYDVRLNRKIGVFVLEGELP